MSASETPLSDASRITAYGEGGIENGLGFSAVTLKDCRAIELRLRECVEALEEIHTGRFSRQLKDKIEAAITNAGKPVL
jgi:hypothetical protein